MSLPNHYPVHFPYDENSYLDALVQDYLELMGEIIPESPNNNLLTEYSAQSVPQSIEDIHNVDPHK